MTTQQTLRQLAEAATEARVRRDQEVEDQENTVAVLAQMLKNAEGVLDELRSDRRDADAAEQHAWELVELTDYERGL